MKFKKKKKRNTILGPGNPIKTRVGGRTADPVWGALAGQRTAPGRASCAGRSEAGTLSRPGVCQEGSRLSEGCRVRLPGAGRRPEWGSRAGRRRGAGPLKTDGGVGPADGAAGAHDGGHAAASFGSSVSQDCGWTGSGRGHGAEGA